MIQTFEQWIKGSGLDPTFGYLVHESYEPKHFDKGPIVEILPDLAEKIEDHRFCELVDKMGDVKFVFETDADPDNELLARQCYMLHGLLNQVLGGYFAEKKIKGIKEEDIVVQRNIAVPLYKVSKFLNIKYGVNTTYYINWRIEGVDTSKGLPEHIDVRDVKMIHNVQFLTVDENLFFGGSVVGTNYLFMSARILHGINQKIQTDPHNSLQENVRDLRKIKSYITKMIETNTYIGLNIRKDLFSVVFKTSIGGFKDVIFEGVDEKRLSSFGGSGGLDPMFQMFERMVGIKYQGGEKKAQEVFQKGIPNTILKLMADCDSWLIRQYCELHPNLTSAYNSLISQYAKFFYFHSYLVVKYVISKNPNEIAGLAGVVMRDILNRADTIQKHCHAQ